MRHGDVVMLLTEDIQGVRCIRTTGDDEWTKGRLQSHGGGKEARNLKVLLGATQVYYE